jgi:hypothetical protein
VRSIAKIRRHRLGDGGRVAGCSICCRKATLMLELVPSAGCSFVSYACESHALKVSKQMFLAQGTVGGSK